MVDPFIRAKLKKKYPNEQVLVVPYSDISESVPDGFAPGNMIDPCSFGNSRFVMRHDAEYNDALIQIIPYVVVTNSKHSKVYVSKRIAGDERLKAKWSFFGGHINPCDSGKRGYVLNAAMRELNEELDIRIKKGSALKELGTVRDIISHTKEHIGIVHEAVAVSARIREKDNLEGKWMSIEELTTRYNEFESWARHIIDWIFVENRKRKEAGISSEGGRTCPQRKKKELL